MTGDCSFRRVGREEELSHVVIRRELSGFRELWHPVGGRMQGTGTGLGFCNLSLSQSVLQAWLGVMGETVPLLHWSLAQRGVRGVGSGGNSVLRNLILHREPTLEW